MINEIEEIIKDLNPPKDITYEIDPIKKILFVKWKSSAEDHHNFKIYLDGKLIAETSERKAEIKLDEFGRTYKLNVSAFDPLSFKESNLAPDLFVVMELPEGLGDPRYNIPSKIGNILVTYQK